MTLEQAKQLLDKNEMLSIEGNLYNDLEYVHWRAGNNTVTLDGNFDADLLMAIAIWMDHVNELLKSPKPEKKIIPLDDLIGSDIDCEFDSGYNDWSCVSPLKSTTGYKDHPYKPTIKLEGEDRYFSQCRIRQDHWHSWQGGECPLPEGLQIEYQINELQRRIYTCNSDESDWSRIIAFKVLGTADGWCYEWQLKDKDE